MIVLIIILFVLFILLRLVTNRNIQEDFVDTRLVQSFRIKIGVYYHKDYETMYRYVYKMSSFMPIDIIKYDNRYRPFYELIKKNVDFIFTNEKDYYIYWINKLKKKNTLIDKFRRNPQIQVITMAYHLYLLIVADYNKIIRNSDINGSVVGIDAKEDLGQDYQIDLLNKYKTHMVYKTDDLNKDYDNLCKETDIMFTINAHPNKLLLEKSNEKEIYLLDTDDFKLSKNYYDKYLFLNKKELDLTYYPNIYQRYNSINRLGSLLIDTSPKMNAFSIKTVLLGLDTLSDDYVYSFMKVYLSNIFDAIKGVSYFNNFEEIDISASRLTGNNAIIDVHDGARKFYRKISNYTFNSDTACALLRNECTDKQLAEYGEYIKNQF
jgi:TRAP-type uncharacterized transport system substrate-binding protein